MLTVTWAKGPDGGWFEFERYDFGAIKTVGVYHIWGVGHQRRFNVRTGQGVIGPRLMAHRADIEITRHRSSGTLYVTWAEVPKAYLDGVERFLAYYFQPLEGDRFPDAVPIAVNLPGQ